jgi:hypothetical protein
MTGGRDGDDDAAQGYGTALVTADRPQDGACVTNPARGFNLSGVVVVLAP